MIKNECSNSVTTNLSLYSINKMSIICNMQRDTLFSNPLYLDIGDCIYTCQYCDAFFWFNEISNETNIEMPFLLDNLLNYHGGSESTYYRTNIRTFNSMLAFTLFRANIDTSARDSHDPHIFKINGQVHYLLGSLLPVDNNYPRFAQLYLYDTENKIQNRMSTVSFDECSKIITETIIKILIKMLDENNILVQLFQTIRDWHKETSIAYIKIRPIGRQNLNSNQYDLPTSNDIGGLIVGDIGEYKKGTDIIVKSKSNNLQRITKLHPSYMSLQYPLLFPYREDGYRIYLNLSLDHTNKNIFEKKNFDKSILLLLITTMPKSRIYFI